MIYISIGSNLGNRLDNLYRAVTLIEQKLLHNTKLSIILETKAILPENAPNNWDKPFLNMIIAGNTNVSPAEALQILQDIELLIGRPLFYEKWSPRQIDLDILLWDNINIITQYLTIPHPEIKNRPFVQHLLALMEVKPYNRQPTNLNKSFINSLVIKPRFVGIVNITMDSFSDGEQFYKTDNAIAHINKLIDDGASIIELGAQSTRPGAIIHSEEHEFSTLENIINELSFSKNLSDITISIDTFRPEIAIKLLKKYKIDIINDVQGNFDRDSLKYIADSGCKFCLMHSLSIPPTQNNIIPLDKNPIDTILEWGYFHIAHLKNIGFTIENIIIDPGIGFSKTAYQSIEILKHVNKLKELGVKIMIGHSRKSFITTFANKPNAVTRDIETVGISCALQNKVDFLRVHNIKDHIHALVAENLLTTN